MNCSNNLIDQDILTPGSFSCINCLQLSILFTQIEGNDFNDLFTPNATREMLQKDYEKLKSMVFDPFNQNSDMPDLEIHQYQGIMDNIAKCGYYLEEKFKSEISNCLLVIPIFLYSI